MSTMTDGEGGVNRGGGRHGFARRCALKRGMCPTSGAHEHAGLGLGSSLRNGGAGDVALTVNAPCACLERGVSESLSSPQAEMGRCEELSRLVLDFV
jgi:hypothetical protein